MEFILEDHNIKIIHKKSYSTGITFEYKNQLFYYKRTKSIGDCYNELIAEKIAKRLKIDCCHYEMASFEGGIGCISEMFSRDNYISMEDFLKKSYHTKETDEKNNLEDIWNAFYISFGEEVTQKLMDALVNIFLFDVLIGNVDRHNENYGLILDGENVRFAPLYDNENMLSSPSLYDEVYSLGIDREDYKTSENLFYKFLKISDDSYRERLISMLPVIKEESLKEIFKELEQEGTEINEFIKINLLKRFSINLNMIENNLKSFRKR